MVDERGDFLAGWIVGVGEGEHFADVFQVEAGRLRRADKLQAFGGARGVRAVVGSGAGVGLQESLAFVKADGGGGNAGSAGELAAGVSGAGVHLGEVKNGSTVEHAGE